MAEKVKLTREQAEHIELIKNDRCVKTVIRDVFFSDIKYRKKGSVNNVIMNIGFEKTLRAVYAGYEVEPEFKVGDWVVRTKELGHQNFYEGKIFKVKRIDKSYLTGDLLVVDNDDNSEHLFENIRHATPDEIAEEKQRRWWAKHNRDVWELRINDLLVDRDGVVHRVTKAMEEIHLEFNTVPLNIIKVAHRVACFAEDRKDIEQ